MPEAVIGLAAFNKRLLNLIRALPDELDRAVVAEADAILQVAKSRTPVDTGELVDSGIINKISTQGSMESSAQISFGSFGESANYAIYVHEDLDANHPNGGQAKFLESAIQEATPGMSSRIGARIKLERLFT